MNTRKLLVSALMLVCVLLSACTATPFVPTFRLPKTTYLTQELKIPMSVTFSADWNVEDDSPIIWSVEYKKMLGVKVGINIVSGAELEDSYGNKIPFPDDFLAWMVANPAFENVKSTPVFISGIEAIQIDAMPITKISKKPFLFLTTSTWNLLSGDDEWRVILMDNVNGERVLINIIAPNGIPLSALPTEVQEILDSIVFLPR